MREARPVGAAADDRVHRLDPEPSHGLDRRLDHLGMPLDHLAHVPVLLLLAHVDRRARLALAHLIREPPDQRQVLLDLAEVVVADDQLDHRLLGAARDARRVDEPLSLLGRLGRERVARQRRDEVRRELDRVHELALGGAGMRRAAADRDEDLPGVERLGLDLAELGAVQRVGVPGAEALEVEVVRAARDLLVHREADAERGMLDVRIPLQVGDGRHDLGHARLVVRAEQRRAVGGDDVVADLLGEQRQLLGIEHDSLAGKLDHAAVVALVHLRVDARAGHVRRGVDVRDQPDRGRLLDARQRAVDVAVLVEAHVVEPDLLELVTEKPSEVELLLGRGRGIDAVRRLGVDPGVAEEAVEHVVRELRRERRQELGFTRGRQGGCRAPSSSRCRAGRIRRACARSASARCSPAARSRSGSSGCPCPSARA